MFRGIPVDVASIYEGESIHADKAYADLGRELGVELLRVASDTEVADGQVYVTGKNIQDIKKGDNLPFGIYIKVAGERLEEDIEGVFERRIHELMNYIQGFMHNGSRDSMWCRISDESAEAGLNLEHIGRALIELFKKEYRVIEKMEVSFYTEKEKVEELLKTTREVFARRDEKIKSIRDEDVDVFYGCLLCQSHAPNHVCIISPSRTSNCGSISWLEAKAAVKIDPNGPIFEVPKGETIEEFKGEFSGVDEAIKEKSSGSTEKVYLHSMFDHPHTSCGCAEAISFFIPEVNGFGIVDSAFKGNTPFGMDFSALIKQIGGGIPTPGFLGISYAYMKSDKFLQGDDGWKRVVWMPSALKKRFSDYIAEDIIDKIATEKEAENLDSLRSFLLNKKHPAIKEKEDNSEKPDVSRPVSIPISRGKVKVVFDGINFRVDELIITSTDDD